MKWIAVCSNCWDDGKPPPGRRIGVEFLQKMCQHFFSRYNIIYYDHWIILFSSSHFVSFLASLITLQIFRVINAEPYRNWGAMTIPVPFYQDYR